MELDWPAGSCERRRSSPLDPSRAKGRAWGPCMRIRTLVTPICSSIRLSLPHGCHGDLSGITVSLIPQRKQYSVWTLSVGLRGSQSAGPIPHKQGLLTKGSILPEGQLRCRSSIWAHFIPWHLPLVCFWSHTTASMLLVISWSEVNWCGCLHPPASRPLGPTEHRASFFLVFLSLPLTHQAGLLELNGISNNAINIPIFIFAPLTLSPVRIDSPFLGLRAWQS